MPVKKASAKKYTDKQKAAYYKKLAITGHGAYRVSRARGHYSALKGHGGYYDSRFVKFMKDNVPDGTFKSVGSQFGGPIGGLLGSGLAKLAGFGAYSVNYNTVAKRLSEGPAPAMMHSVDSSVRVRHREYITDIVSSGSANTFSNQSFPINPGLVQSFPWLSNIAQAYQQYKLHGLVFYYKPLSGTAIASSTNPTMGGVVMATNYVPNGDNNSGVYVNKQQMENTQYTTSCPIYEHVYHPVECDQSQQAINYLTVRNGSIPTGSDQRIFDWGVFNIASFGLQGTSVVCGELWCSYDVELCKPVETSALNQDVLSDHFKLATVSATNPLGTTSSAAANSSIGGSINTAGTTYSFPSVYQEGTYLFYYQVTGTAAVIAAPTFTFTNCSVLAIMKGDTVGTLSCPANGVSSAVYTNAFVVSITGMNATVAWSTGSTIPTSVTSGDLFVTQWDENIST